LTRKELKSTNVGVFIPARNEEKLISKTLECVLNQELKPYRIVVVDDGSTDETAKIVSEFSNVELVNSTRTDLDRENFKTAPMILNTGLQKFSTDSQCDFVLRLDADHLLSSNYISTIVTRLQDNSNIVIASGIIKGENSKVPRGSGRIVSSNFWKKINFCYPLNYGWDTYILLKAKSLGFDYAIYQDIVSETQRKTGSKMYNPKLYRNRGRALKALGYTFPYALHRTLTTAKKNPIDAFCLLKGFLSPYKDLYEPELREYVKRTQNKIIKNN
jgi:glycosyltransferase involved in cell wall biosynthesis